jgi:Ring finger domain
MATEETFIRQLIDSIGFLERELGRIRGAAERRLAAPVVAQLPQQQYVRYGRRRRYRRRPEVVPPAPPINTIRQRPAIVPIQNLMDTDSEDEAMEAILAMSLQEAQAGENVRRQPVRIRIPKLKTRAIKAAEINLPISDNCAICQETHVKSDSIETSCGHQFGQACFLGWVETKLNNRQDLCCPLCMHKNPTYHGFRARKQAVPRARLPAGDVAASVTVR